MLGSSVNYHLFTRSDFEMLFLNYLANFKLYLFDDCDVWLREDIEYQSK